MFPSENCGFRGEGRLWLLVQRVPPVPGFPHPCVSKISELRVCPEWGRQTALSFPFPCPGGFPLSPPNANMVVQEQRPPFPMRARTPGLRSGRAHAHTSFGKAVARSVFLMNEGAVTPWDVLLMY